MKKPVVLLVTQLQRKRLLRKSFVGFGEKKRRTAVLRTGVFPGSTGSATIRIDQELVEAVFILVETFQPEIVDTFRNVGPRILERRTSP